jgi:hypothetical protein
MGAKAMTSSLPTYRFSALLLDPRVCPEKLNSASGKDAAGNL